MRCPKKIWKCVQWRKKKKHWILWVQICTCKKIQSVYHKIECTHLLNQHYHYLSESWMVIWLLVSDVSKEIFFHVNFSNPRLVCYISPITVLLEHKLFSHSWHLPKISHPQISLYSNFMDILVQVLHFFWAFQTALVKCQSAVPGRGGGDYMVTRPGSR